MGEEPQLRLNRRTAVGGFAGGILASAGMVPVGQAVFAQDATPEVEEAAASPEEEGALPRVPPEMEEFANDWPAAQQNYEATRVATSSTIDSSNVDQLGVAWEFDFKASSPYGAITSNPLVLGNTIYLIENNGRI